ncbi:pyruvate formate lyase family protein [Bacillota bacterium Meth-B3]
MATIGTPARVTQMANALFQEERAMKRLDGWFLVRESHMRHAAEYAQLPPMERAACLLREAIKELKLSISEHALFAGTQRDAFARSYALINPSFQVESFAGYCDPTAVYGDIEPNDEFPAERIARARAFDSGSDYVRALSATYARHERLTGEVAFFMEQVTGHIVPDLRAMLSGGVRAAIERIDRRISGEADENVRSNLNAMRIALESACLLAGRYAQLAATLEQAAEGERRAQLTRMREALEKVPMRGADTLYEAIQSFMLLWQVMCLEQAPNPFAFSVGNADRIFEPFRAKERLPREDAAALLKHLLVFFNVGDRSWAISQNLIVGGRDLKGNDLTCETSYALLDAYFDMNLPQPILSIKLHSGTPDRLYGEMGRFFFTPGCLTPSLFNDDAMFEVLRAGGIAGDDLPDYGIAGCQEPLIMGKDNGNTTNTWLNLPKILELTLSGGTSTVTGAKIATYVQDAQPLEALRNVRERFYENLRHFLAQMEDAANGASRAVARLPVPFLSTLMGGIESGYDMRDAAHQGTRYNASGCLIHGLSVLADSFVAIDCLLRDRPEDAGRLLEALKRNFEGDEELRDYLRACPKFGGNEDAPDAEAAEIADKVSDMVASLKNYLGNPFRPDFSTPSTHLLYGYWVGATPDGRGAREMLNYGVDPLAGDASGGLGLRTLSAMKLPYIKFTGGYASHFGIDPKYFKGETLMEKGMEFKRKVFSPLFFNEMNERLAPFYLYLNITTPEMLRKVLANPKKYAPGGVYIMRIHGTFVNFLDLSPAIQQDIIKRLDPASTTMEVAG